LLEIFLLLLPLLFFTPGIIIFKKNFTLGIIIIIIIMQFLTRRVSVSYDEIAGW